MSKHWKKGKAWILRSPKGFEFHFRDKGDAQRFRTSRRFLGLWHYILVHGVGLR